MKKIRPLYTMPYTRSRRNFGRFRRRRYANNYYRSTRVGAPLGRAPRWRRRQRVGQNLTRNVFWFKLTGEIRPLGGALAGEIFQRFLPNQVTLSNQFDRFAYLYEQFKVLKMVVKFFPANVGAENISTVAILPNFQRGNVLTYVEQPPIAVAPPGTLQSVMSLPSARIHQPRRMVKRYIDRPRGGRTNVWTLIDHVVGTGAPAFQPEAWTSQIRIFGNNWIADTTQPVYFYEQYFKVVFRSRYTAA